MVPGASRTIKGIRDHTMGIVYLAPELVNCRFKQSHLRPLIVPTQTHHLPAPCQFFLLKYQPSSLNVCSPSIAFTTCLDFSKLALLYYAS